MKTIVYEDTHSKHTPIPEAMNAYQVFIPPD
jgi:hypothetical protein